MQCWKRPSVQPSPRRLLPGGRRAGRREGGGSPLPGSIRQVRLRSPGGTVGRSVSFPCPSLPPPLPSSALPSRAQRSSAGFPLGRPASARAQRSCRHRRRRRKAAPTRGSAHAVCAKRHSREPQSLAGSPRDFPPSPLRRSYGGTANSPPPPHTHSLSARGTQAAARSSASLHVREGFEFLLVSPSLC